MGKLATLVLALLYHPLPVTSLTGSVAAGGDVTLQWTLPADPSVVGITIYRDHLGSSQTVVFVLPGLQTTYTDSSADPDESYRYWVHTRDAQGDLSDGVYFEVFGDGHGHGHSEWWCVVTSVSGAPPPWAALGAAGLLALASLLRRR